MRPVRILTVTVILTGMFALPAIADETTTTTTVAEVEVCRDGQIISIPPDQMVDSDDRITNDFQRDNCQPPRIPTPTTIPEVVIRFPLIRVGYACPGTDGTIVELPWGSYEDMWPTVELAALYGCPVEQPTVDSPTVAPVAVSPVVETSVVEKLPFTGPSDMAGLLAAGLAALILGGLLVGLARRPV